MSLSNLQYDEIQRQYDARQLRSQRILQERRAKVFAKYPRLKELEELERREGKSKLNDN